MPVGALLRQRYEKRMNVQTFWGIFARRGLLPPICIGRRNRRWPYTSLRPHSCHSPHAEGRGSEVRHKPQTLLLFPICTVLVAAMRLHISELRKLSQVTLRSCGGEPKVRHDGLCCDFFFVGHVLQNIDHFLRQQWLYRPFPSSTPLYRPFHLPCSFCIGLCLMPNADNGSLRWALHIGDQILV